MLQQLQGIISERMESLAFSFESTAIKARQWLVRSGYNKAMTSGFDIDLVGSEITKEELIDIIYYNYHGHRPDKFIII